MALTLQLVLFVFAFVLFAIAALGVDARGYNLIAEGLAFATAGFVFA